MSTETLLTDQNFHTLMVKEKNKETQQLSITPLNLIQPNSNFILGRVLYITISWPRQKNTQTIPSYLLFFLLFATLKNTSGGSVVSHFPAKQGVTPTSSFPISYVLTEANEPPTAAFCNHRKTTILKLSGIHTAKYPQNITTHCLYRFIGASPPITTRNRHPPPISGEEITQQLPPL